MESQRKPVVYASHALSETERRYAQIEKEAFAIAWACEKFSDYILGKTITIETDHKPLVPLLGRKHLDNLPPQVIRFCLRLDQFHFFIVHVPGKHLYIADALCRSPSPITNGDLNNLDVLAELSMKSRVAYLPSSKEWLETYRKAQKSDSTCSLLKKYCCEGWLEQVHEMAKPYLQVQGDLTIGEDLLLRDGRIVVPPPLREETLKKLH